MNISDFDYTLLEKNIALHPPKTRGATRLLVLNRQNGAIKHQHYPDLIEHLQRGDVVVLNNTRVIKARLRAINSKGQQRELLLLESHQDEALNKRRVLYRGRLIDNEVLTVAEQPITISKIYDGGIALISSKTDLLRLAAEHGSVPLPPYLKRDADNIDVTRYQTEFAQKSGSVAAPTASLNFTNELASKLKAKGVRVVYLTLHVGLGTFLPIRSNNVEEHTMHSEYFEIPAETIRTIQEAKATGRQILAIGTTVSRTLEYTAEKVLSSKGQSLSGEANIFIYPGYKFKVIDKLLTNFHAPRSTVLMMAAAFAGQDHLMQAYKEALSDNYAFLSYGDSMLIE